MNDKERAQDDFDIEIMDIPESEQDGDTNDGNTASTSPPARSPMVSRFSPRQRRLRATAIGGIVVLLALIILGSDSSVRDTVRLSLFGPKPTPSATLAPGFDLFYIESTLSWGQVSLDGHVISHLPRAEVDPPLRLAPGRHQLAWQAEPFRLSQCTISIPPATTDTCNYNRVVRTPSGIDAWLITFSPSLATLPAPQRIKLIEAAQAALDGLQSTETVRPGEHYAHTYLSGQNFEIATQPLRATLRFQLDTGDPSEDPCAVQQIIVAVCQIRGFDCRLFCTIDIGPLDQSPAENFWDVSAVIYSTWKYVTTEGKVVAENQLDSALSGQGVEHNISLHISRDSAGWHVRVGALWNRLDQHITSPSSLAGIPGQNLPCASAEEDIGLDGYYGLTGGSINAAVDWTFVSGANPAAGCLAIGTPQQDTTGSSPSPDLPVAYCLHRFGVLLAANEAAHRYWPNMPLADAYERGLAQQLMGSVRT
jgi:hypothetical protein